MPVESVSSGSNVATQLQSREAADNAQRQLAVEAAQRRKSEVEAVKNDNRQAEVPEPKPVVNAQGQTTGRVISTSA